MGGVGPMAGQVHHFRNYARGDADLCNQPLHQRGEPALWRHEYRASRTAPFIAGKYSIADMALVGWVNGWERQGQDINEFPNLKRWLETMKARPAVKRGMALGLELRQGIDMKDPKVQAVLFNQRRVRRLKR